MHRVAVTGIGIVSCLGNDTKTVARALRAGASGIGIDPRRIELGFRSALTGIIHQFDRNLYLTKKQRKTMPDSAVQAYAAIKEALGMSGLSEKELENTDTGLIFGCDSSVQAAVEQVDLLKKFNKSRSIGSGLVFKVMTSSITANLNTILKTRGACWTISSACSSSSHAVGQSADLIAAGRQERVICGGAQEINWEAMCGFDAIGAFSTRTDDPPAASRPFDAERDGLVPSGGAAALILERLESAKRRGAIILGEIASYAFSSDGGHISVPSEDGMLNAMKMALARARMASDEIDYICAHATSTPIGDAIEALSISTVFGPKTPYVSSVKSMTGHELSMAGASSTVYSIIMAQGGFIAPNINFKTQDHTCKTLNIVSETINRSIRTVMCNACGFGGTNSCLILRFD